MTIHKDFKEVFITREARIRDAFELLDRTGAGILLLVDNEQRLERTITDGDLRRELLAERTLEDTLDTLPQRTPLTIAPETGSTEALAAMDEAGINQLPVVDDRGQVLAILDRRDFDSRILLSTPHMGDDEFQFVREAFRTNWIAPLGPNVDAFENEFCDQLGHRHAAALSSGTAALHLALRLLDVRQDDIVFCSSFTFVATMNPVLYEKAIPVLIDSEPGSWNMSPLALERAFEAATRSGKMPKAVMVAHLYGQSSDMDPIMEICDAYGVPVIEDAAETVGTLYKGKPSGSFGRVAAYSFNGNKIITTSGGGMLTSDDPDLVARARHLATQAREPAPHYEHTEIGYNYRMSNILAGVGRGQLRVLDERIASRRAVFARYRDGLAGIDGIHWMPEPDWSFSTRWLTTCTIDAQAFGMEARVLSEKLQNQGIESRPVWKPMHLQPLLEGAEYFPHGNTSVSDELFATGLCLPSGSNLTDREIERVIERIREQAS